MYNKNKRESGIYKTHHYEIIGYIKNVICIDKSKFSLRNNHLVKVTRDKRDGEI